MSYALPTEHMGMDGRIVNDIIPQHCTPIGGQCSTPIDTLEEGKAIWREKFVA